MTDYSVLVPFVPRRPEQVLPFAALVSWTNAARLWQGQSMVVDAHQSFAYAAGAGFRVPTGLGVTLMPLRHPYEAAAQARSLALTTGRSVVAGFGPGATSAQYGISGAPYASPLGATREYLSIVRELLEGHTPDITGRYFSCHTALPQNPGAEVHVGLGVLRTGMAKLAGELADSAITWLTPARYLDAVVVPALREGATAADRPVPRLTAIVPLALAADDRDPVQLALASNAAHLHGPHYRDMLRRAGVPLGDDVADSDAAALLDGGAFLSGDVCRLTDKLAEYAAAGVDEIVLNLTGVCALYGPRAALADLETLLAALEP